MQFFLGIIDFILHIDIHLQTLLNEYGTRLYGILFAIIFVETGLVIMPLLPGDSLLFVAGSLAGSGYLEILPLIAILIVAAIAGDTVNYHIGKYFGNRILKRRIRGRHILKPEYVERTKKFFDKYGKRTIILARFVPIVRTIAPFIAGIGDMKYRTFISYNIIGGVVRILALTLAGYFFGQIPFVKDNFEKVVLAIIAISLIPIIIEYLKHKFKKQE